MSLHQDSTLAQVTLQFEPRTATASMTRTQFLRDVLSPPFVGIFKRFQRVHRLELLQLIVPEPKGSNYDACWWRKQAARRMPYTEVAAHVDTSDTGESRRTYTQSSHAHYLFSTQMHLKCGMTKASLTRNHPRTSGGTSCPGQEAQCSPFVTGLAICPDLVSMYHVDRSLLVGYLVPLRNLCRGSVRPRRCSELTRGLFSRIGSRRRYRERTLLTSRQVTHQLAVPLARRMLMLTQVRTPIRMMFPKSVWTGLLVFVCPDTVGLAGDVGKAGARSFTRSGLTVL